MCMLAFTVQLIMLSRRQTLQKLQWFNLVLQPLLQPLNLQNQQLRIQKNLLLLVLVDQACQRVHCGVSLEDALHLSSLLPSLSLSAVFAKGSQIIVVLLKVSKVFLSVALTLGNFNYRVCALSRNKKLIKSKTM